MHNNVPMNPNDLSIPELLDTLEEQLRATLNNRKLTDPLMIGIHSGGVWVAEQMHQRLGLSNPLGLLDISFYRDDFSQLGINPFVKPSQLPKDIESRDIILIDDVFYTGRTVRAALNEIFDYGRPASITLVVLVDRSSNRELPIQADIIGKSIALDAEEHVKLHGPEPLMLSITNIESAGTKKMG